MRIARLLIPLTLSLSLTTLAQGHPQIPRPSMGTAATTDGTGSGFCPLDVYFLIDLTGGFGGELAAFADAAPVVLPALQASNPNTRFGLGGFQDYPFSPYGEHGDEAYVRVVDLTFDTVAFISGIHGLSAQGGGDGPESQLPALYETATGIGHCVAWGESYCVLPDQQANFRGSATKLILLWTDASFHQDYPFSAPSFAQAVVAIDALGYSKVLGISSAGGGLTDLQSIADATGALAPAGGVDCDGDGMNDIHAGQPLVCTVGQHGEGIGEVVTTLVDAVAECRVFLPIVQNH